MRRNIADTCSLDVSGVSVKATTEEGLGFTGRREGISASAVALLRSDLISDAFYVIIRIEERYAYVY